MRKPVEPTVSLSTRIGLETDRRRRRLLRQMKCSMPQLMKRAFEQLELSLKDDRKEPEAA